MAPNQTERMEPEIAALQQHLTEALALADKLGETIAAIRIQEAMDALVR